MVMSTLTVAGINPALSILGANQQFIFAPNLSAIQFDSAFIPTISIPSQQNFEYRNSNLSGFRWIHLTNSTDTFGSLTLQSFTSASPTGTNFMSFNSTGISFASAVLMSANLNMQNNKVINLLDPTSAQDAATKNYTDTRVITLTGAVTGSGALGSSIVTTLTSITTSQISNFNAAVTAYRLDQFAVPTSSVSLNSQKIINLLNPTNAQDAATKAYVDTSTGGVATSVTLTGAVTGTGTTGSSITTSAAAKYILQTSNASVPNAQVLGSLTTGLVKNTTTTGVLSIGVAGTDYYSPGNPTRLIDTSGASTNNFFAGTNAGNNTMTGNSNLGVGPYVLSSITSGVENVALGNFASSSITTASGCTSIGNRAAAGNISGGNNISLGDYAAYAATTSVSSISIGNYAGGNNNGSTNLTVGHSSSFALPSGINNCVFGHFGLTLATTASNNCVIGTYAGSSYASYNNCTFLGYNADATSSGLTNATAIGFGAQVSVSNAIVLGNGCNVGIGTSSPNSPLQFANGAVNRIITLYENANNQHQFDGLGIGTGFFRFQCYSTGDNFAFFAGTSSTTSNELMRLTGTGYLGIGTSTPHAPIQLANSGISIFRQVVFYEASNNDYQTNSIGSSLFGSSINMRYNVYTNDVSSAHVWTAGTSSTTSIELMRLNGLGYLGIGITTPNAPLQFANSTATRQVVFYEAANNDHQVNAVGRNSGIFRFQLNNTTDRYAFFAGTSSTTSNELLTFTGTGYLGVGTSAPNAPLQFSGASANRIIVLYQAVSGSGNDNQFIGLGLSSGTFRFQLDSIGESYVFFAGTSSTTSNEVARITGGGDFILPGTAYLKRPYGSVYMTNNATSNTLTAATWTKIAGTTISSSLNQFASPSSNRLTYTSTSSTSNALVIATVAANNNFAGGTPIGIAIFKNGAMVGAPTFSTPSAANQTQSLSISAYVSFTTNDYVEVWVQTTSASTLVVPHLVLSVSTL